MTLLVPSRSSLIQIEDVQYRSAVSESVGQRLGQLSNFIATYQHNRHSFHLNGPYVKLPFDGPDGVFANLFNMEIVGVAYYNGVAGSSGTTTVDVRLLDNDGSDLGSIFSTKPAISNSAASNTTTIIDLITPQSFVPTGHTAAVLSTTEVNAGQVLRMDIDTAMTGAQNFQLTIMYRPID